MFFTALFEFILLTLNFLNAFSVCLQAYQLYHDAYVDNFSDLNRLFFSVMSNGLQKNDNIPSHTYDYVSLVREL